ncbi:serine hydrolase [Virgibacillus dakarensis]|uniref:Serine hydrolase n=1 Tax=Lentibacillus populi TaxID=1827502 RepID=A0A9W5TYA7_9BACI|nr:MULTISPECIES: serine hydrolase domain-containing protein [Bacillaceae]MBT2217581.1 serine hydrolase [Virgibacillus dakarensis]MTW86971.1 serine hydrolase [Virgibacillus dakarensis]GGB45453.1 hypothetical protein GCM10011409_23770 [Lentibacillus populi]
MKKRMILVLYAFTLWFSVLMIQPQAGYAAANELPPGTAGSVEMLEQPLADLDEGINDAISEQVMPGAVVLIARNGKVVKHDAYGYAARYTDADFTEMDEPVKMQADTIFDMASISKLFTAVGVMQLWDQGLFKLDDPVSDYLPEYDTDEKGDITIKQLLTHTSGEKPGPSGNIYDMDGTREELLEYVMREPLQYEPGEEYVYSDINYITLGVLIERLSGNRQDVFIRENILEPLQMSDTMYNPPEELKPRIAATEFQPWTDRGLVWGSVHDEKAWALDGVAGHAGVFSSAEDMAIFAQMLLNEGSYQGQQIVSEGTFELMNKNWNEAYPGQNHGLGWDLNQDWYMDVLAEENTLGHTGYTGTSMVVSPKLKTIAILLTNRVHPTRDTVSTNPIRKTVAEKTASSIYAWNAATMKEQVASLKEKGDVSTDAARSLRLHLTAVSHYEETGQVEKVLKHLEGMKTMLEFQRISQLISEEAYHTLTSDTKYLMGKWRE